MVRMLKGKEAADTVYEAVRQKVEAWKAKGIVPQLAVVLVEGDPASAYYAEAKRKIAGRLGVSFQLHTLPEDAEEAGLLALVDRLNRDLEVHGIMLELPLPGHLNAAVVEAAISPDKDIDGVTPGSRLAVMTGAPGLYPATPQACIELLLHYGYELAGRNVTLVGRGRTVGLPLFHMLQREQATVTVCHSRTPDLAAHLGHADIAVVAAGKANLVTEEMVHTGLVVVDAGINETADGGIAGDVSSGVQHRAAAVSPVPGGVGSLTTAILFRNLLLAVDKTATAGDGPDADTAADAVSGAAGRRTVWDGTIRSFMDRAGSADPTPGGGSVAAVAAALGAAMTAMVGNLSQGERIEPEARERMAAAVGEMNELSGRCESLLEADMTSFTRYMDALRLPKETDEDKLKRRDALQYAAAASIDVPLRLMELCLEGMRRAGEIAGSANRNVISDLGIGVIQFEAAARSALLTVQINLASLRDPGEKMRYAGQSARLMGEMEALKQRILDDVGRRMAE